MAHRQFEHAVLEFVADAAPITTVGLVDWSSLDWYLICIGAAANGVPDWPPLTLFRALLLAIWYRLLDVKLAEALEDRASFWRFCGLVTHERTPECSAFVRFRRQLARHGLDKIRFDEVTR
jgi:transposase, IS5 family